MRAAQEVEPREVRAPATSRALSALVGLGLMVLFLTTATSFAPTEHRLLGDVSVSLTPGPGLAVGILGLLLLVAAAIPDGRPVEAGIGCLLVPAGVAVVAATDSLLAHLEVGRRTGWVLIVAGCLALLAAMLEAVHEVPRTPAPPPEDQQVRPVMSFGALVQEVDSSSRHP